MDVIRCDQRDYLIWKWSPDGIPGNRENAIRMGSSLRVKESEVAVFVYKRDENPYDYIEGPHDEILKTANLPVLASIVGLAYDGKSPFQAEVYFINLGGNTQFRWAIPLFDSFDPRYPEVGVPTTARGTVTFSYQITENSYTRIG